MLNPAAARRNILLMGELFEWWRADPCSCYDPQSNYDAQQGCAICEGGFIYRQQQIGTPLKGVVSDIKREIIHPEFGLLQVGDTLFEVMPDDAELGNWDKVVFLGRQEQAVDTLIYGTRDTITNSGRIATIIQVSDDTTVYVQGTDYTIATSPAGVTWIAGAAHPTAGKVYAARYTRYPTYWVSTGSLSGARPTALSTQRMSQIVQLHRKREQS